MSRTTSAGPLRRFSVPSARLAALADQALSGLSNFLTVALMARSSDPVGFGRFAVVYALFSAFLGLARQLWGTQIALTTSARHALSLARQLTGAAVCVAPVAALALALPSLAITGLGTLPVIALLVLALPVVVAQDLCRYASIASGRPAVALVSDAVWVATVAVAYAFRPPLLVALSAWLAGAVVALLVALAGLRLLPSIAQGWVALRHRHATGEVTALGYVAASLATYVTLGLATLTVGAAAAGALRGASTVMAPVNTLFAFAGLAMLPVIFRAADASQLGRIGQVSGGLVGASVLWGAVLLLLPAAAGDLLLGDSWAGARSVLAWTVLEYVALATAAGAVLGLQAHGRARHLALVLSSGSVFVLCGALLAAALGDSAAAFAAALAVAAVLYAVVAWLTYLRQRRRGELAMRGQPSSSGMDRPEELAPDGG
jgi:O-antigen/teichoic acid export membrane protein